VHVLQGESEMATYNKTLGKFELVGIPPAPRGVPQIEVGFDIDANGIINVSAKDLGSGNEQQVRIEGGSGLSQEDIDRMMKEADAHREEASRLRELVDARNNAESLAYQIEKSLNENRDKLDAGVASTVEGRIMELRGVLESSDVSEIKAKTDALQQAWTEAAQALYAQASADQPAGGNGSTDGSSSVSDDEVVEDAEYEVVDDK
jgi:molecular chaperone DnaK